jgi:uncharacterized protein (DUF305 family)
MTRFRALTTSAFVFASVFAACGSDEDEMAHDSTGQSPATAAAGAEFNDADVTFAQGMIPHHQQAVEMADIALDPARGAGAEVAGLATRIKAAQDPEIQTMTAWLNEWGAEAPSADHGTEMAGPGMMTDAEMDALGSASGAEFDVMWMEMMIRHHEGAIEMSNTEVESGSNAEAIALAKTIITAQQAEIDEMNRLLAG